MDMELELESEPEQQLPKLLEHLQTVTRSELPKKFQEYFDNGKRCRLEDFALYYLAAVRQHTDLHFRASNETETPKRKAEPDLNESQLRSEMSQLSMGNVSTPRQARRSTGAQFCSTPPSSERGNRSLGGVGGGAVNRSGGAGAANRSGGSGAGVSGSSFCLGDYLLNATPNQRSQKKKPTTANTPQQENNNKSQQKPRRRVLPMTISKHVSAASSSCSFGDTSSFSQENNFLRLSQSCELLERSQGAALEQEARKTLLLHKQQIKSEAPVANLERDDQQPREEPTDDIISLEQVSQAPQLELLAAIYAQLMNLNLVPNVLTELSYVMQLLNIRGMDLITAETKPTTPFSLLSQHKECIYFAIQFLEQQAPLLLQLDCKSLTVLLQHERLSLLNGALLEQLDLAVQNKQQQLKGYSPPAAQAQQVHYQQEQDSRDNFPSQQEFGAFKTQRDLFYKALKHWELTHLNRTFNFNSELGLCLRDIFKQSEHMVNMSHLANLFVSQLLMSSGETLESREELGLELGLEQGSKLDQQRLNRLAQRLVTSNSSVEDQFPRSQAFFRDFITECGSIAFLMQLQLQLYKQLLLLNDSSFELLQLAEELEEEQPITPYIVRPQALAELLLLAKFLGYVCALPYNRSVNPCTNPNQVCTQQLQLRRQFQPPFDFGIHLEHAMQQGKLLITLPWLVQYLIMLDLVTLQLPEYLAILELLYALYAKTLDNTSLQPGAMFITRGCLGWLLESQPALSSDYYNQRRMETTEDKDCLKDCLRSLSFDLDQQKAAACQLEQLLPVACPFLHEFRIAITPSEKRPTQRNGRYRYITTRLEQLNQTHKHTPVADAVHHLKSSPQRKLIDAFLHSQNTSMRRLLEFVTERSFKCVVKDAQQDILLPSKAAADEQVNVIKGTQPQDVKRDLQRIYQLARQQAQQQWTEQVPGMLKQRIEDSLQALLPASTNELVRRTYAHLISTQAQTQLQLWFDASVLQSSFYHGDLQELAGKVCRANKQLLLCSSAANTPSNELCLPACSDLSLSALLHELQQWVHCLSLRPEHLPHLCLLPSLLERALEAALLPQLPDYFYQLLGASVLRLLQLLICRQPQLLSPALIHTSCELWLSPQLRPDSSTPPFFQTALLNLSFVQELSVNLSSFQRLQQLLLAMLNARVLHMDELNQFFMPLFKENWTPPVWSALSQLLQELSQTHTVGDSSKVEDVEDDAKSHLFMELLADLSRDLDSF